MMELFFGDHAGWFATPAIVGTVFFSLRLLLMLVGHSGLDLHADADTGDAHPDSTEAFKVLSIQSIAAFMMGFGWVGLGGLKGAGWDMPVAIGAGVAGGAAMVWVLGMLLRAVYNLQSSGNIPLDRAIGAVGDVYASVPARGQGRGRVRVIVSGRQKIYHAVSDSEPIATNSRVRVVTVNPDNTVTVAPA